ncbi:MAG: bifunctional phosphoribosylaminoimidazolecarboxamide formyltransferase/IMP cyclohydrolase [Frankia sp.]
MPARLVVLASGAGTTLQAVLDACEDPAFGARVVAVGTDRTGTGAESRARAAGIEVVTVRLEDFADRDAFSAATAEAVAAYQPDLLVLAGYMKVLGTAVIGRFRTVNTHPSLLPSFPGAHAVRDALAHGVRVSGVTVHWVDEGVDTGPILAQTAVPVVAEDTADTLRSRIQAVERVLFVETIGKIVRSAENAPGGIVTSAAVPDHADATASAPGETTPADRSTELVAPGRRPIRRALVSVYDKTGLDVLAEAFAQAGVEVVSTGSTADVLARHGLPVTPVSTLTGFPEVLGGRVKTLHPRVHAGLLADLRRPEHAEALAELDIAPFDLVVANLYPFRETVAAGAAEDEVIEQIDIGGPAMIRAAAKNHASVAVVVSPDSYGEVLDALRAGGFDLPERRQLAARAFAHTASYDAAVASWFASVVGPDEVASETGWPRTVAAVWERSEVLRYGENPHQRAALYVGPDAAPGLAQAVQLHGKQMSYNNYTDTDAARRAAYDFDAPCVAIVKHANPCGIALGADVAEAHRKAHACDPTSAFGGVIAVNRPVTVALAGQIAEIFTEVLVAPAFEPGAVEILARKPSIRLLECSSPVPRHGVETRPISGGLLFQSRDAVDAAGDEPSGWTLEAGAPADDATLADLAFAWRAVRAVKSNAILLASDRATVGVGMGQVNRVDAARLAVERAGDRAKGAVAASDAFFPFPDGFEVLAKAGVRAVVEPGGSVRDELVIAAAREAGVAVYFTGVRHFAH